MKTRITILFAASMALLTLTATHVQALNLDALWGITTGGQLIDINTTTGAGTLIANTGLVNAQGLERENDGNLLAIAAAPSGSTPNTLWRIDPANPTNPVVVGPLGPPVLESQAMTFDATGTTLFASGGTDVAEFAPENFVTVNTATGLATVVNPFGPLVVDVDSMAMSPGGVLVGFDSDGHFLPGNSNSFLFVDINPATGAATILQNYGGKPLNGLLAELEFTPDGSVLYGATVPTVNGGAGMLATVNPANGDITLIGPIGFNNVFGMAFVPEPSTFALVGMGGLMALAFMARRRSKATRR